VNGIGVTLTDQIVYSVVVFLFSLNSVLFSATVFEVKIKRTVLVHISLDGGHTRLFWTYFACAI
jgi:hypothetical protein